MPTMGSARLRLFTVYPDPGRTAMSEVAAPQTVSDPPGQRLLSLDALRGFDMFWIMGGEGIAAAAAKLTGWTWLVWLAGQLHHPKWHGFAFYDLIFPLFLFIAGAAMPFSFEKRLAAGVYKGRLVPACDRARPAAGAVGDDL